MKLDIKVSTNDNCKITVLDITEVTEYAKGYGYLKENDTGFHIDRFRYSDTISIDVVELNRYKSKNEVKTIIYSIHKDLKESITLPINFDGYFTISHIVLPTKEWFDKHKNNPNLVNNINIIYYCDGKTIYKYFKKLVEDVPLEEILEINTEGNTISKILKDFISICFLKKCYISLCLLIFNNRGFSKCWDKNNINSELIFKRDLVWMTINVIKYMTQFNLLLEAERIIESIGGCNGLCKLEFYSNKDYDCGCNK